jgi:Ca-activated chloride channel family protein
MTSSEDISPRLSLSLILLFTIAVSAPKVATQTQPANETRIVVTAIDRQQHFVDTLRAEDLRILENGAPQKIVSFRQITDQSASVAILIDASASQERTLPAQKLAATSFVDAIIRPARDKAAVATFTGTLTVQQDLTNDLNLLRQAIARAQFVPPAGYIGSGVVVGSRPPISGTQQALAGSTAIWEAVLDVCDQLFSGSSTQTRRAIILLTDGQDTISKHKLSDAVDRAIRDDVAIFSIGIGDTSAFGVDKDELRKLSERTSGRAFFPKKVSDLSAIFVEIGQELRTQYLIVYKSTNSTVPPRKIQIEIINPALRSRDIRLFYQRLAYKE